MKFAISTILFQVLRAFFFQFDTPIFTGICICYAISMRKRARRTELKAESDSRECMDSLPDDILVSILSRLSLKEAVATSNLSRRWRYLWTQIGGLDFDANDTLDMIAANPKIRPSERTRYINWVNRVVRQHRGDAFHTVRICFDLDKSSKNIIDNWVKLAITKKVQRLELDLLENGDSIRQPLQSYSFPIKFLKLCKESSLKNVDSKSPFVRPSIVMGLKFMKSLLLKCVNVSEKTLECILFTCPALHHLSVHGSGDLMKVKVCGSSLALKHLEIVFCVGIEAIEIRDINLISFNYLGDAIDLVINNVPKLKDISIGEGYFGLKNNVFGQISCCLHQLEILTLDIYRPEENLKIFMFPELPKVKELVLKVGAWDDQSLLEFTSLLKACPKLNKFVLQLIWMSPSRRRRKMREAIKCAHEHLLVVELNGYYGRTSDAELAMYFIQNAGSLQKMIIDPRNQILDRAPARKTEILKEEAARRYAKKQLESKKPPKVELLIL